MSIVKKDCWLLSTSCDRTETIQQQWRDEVRRLQALLNGETVRGCTLGDPGLDRAWVEHTLALRKQQLEHVATMPPDYDPTSLANTPYEDLDLLWELRTLTYPNVLYPVDEEPERRARIRTICEHFGVQYPEELLDTHGTPRRTRKGRS